MNFTNKIKNKQESSKSLISSKSKNKSKVVRGQSVKHLALSKLLSSKVASATPKPIFSEITPVGSIKRPRQDFKKKKENGDMDLSVSESL